MQVLITLQYGFISPRIFPKTPIATPVSPRQAAGRSDREQEKETIELSHS